MNYTKLITGGLSFLGILILILDGKTALEGANAGIMLCIQAVIPSMFPFFVLSSIFSTSLTGIHIPILKPIAAFCGLPSGAEPLLIAGFLGGYPAGAQCIFQAYSSGNLTKKDSERLLRFCSNAGPAFLFGMVSPLFPGPSYAWKLWGIHIASSLLIGFFSSHNSGSQNIPVPRAAPSLSDSVLTSVRAMAAVCGWCILFRVLITFFEHWFFWLLPGEIQVLFTGLMELSNGCIALREIESIELRFLLCSVFLSFGGLCVTMQTSSVIGDLSPWPYLRGRCLHTLFSLILSALIITNRSAFFLAAIPLLLFFRKKRKIPIAIGPALLYNEKV